MKTSLKTNDMVQQMSLKSSNFHQEGTERHTEPQFWATLNLISLERLIQVR